MLKIQTDNGLHLVTTNVTENQPYLAHDIHRVPHVRQCNYTKIGGEYERTVLLSLAKSCDPPCDKCRNYLEIPTERENT